MSALFNAMLKNLLRCVADPVEKNRELSVSLLGELSKYTPPSAAMMSYIVPVLTTRIGSKEVSHDLLHQLQT